MAANRFDLPANATPAQRKEYMRNLWNHYLLDPAWRSTRFNTQPNALLVEATGNRRPGMALDVNMGEGRNALYLAQQGWHVVGVDIADQALAFAQSKAQQLNINVSTITQDIAAFDWGINKWDLVLLCYADESMHLPQVCAALKPGGILVFENFHADINSTRSIKTTETIGFGTDEAKNSYATAGLQILHYAEPVRLADFSQETHRLVQLIALKPLPPH